MLSEAEVRGFIDGSCLRTQEETYPSRMRGGGIIGSNIIITITTNSIMTEHD